MVNLIEKVADARWFRRRSLRSQSRILHFLGGILGLKFVAAEGLERLHVKLHEA